MNLDYYYRHELDFYDFFVFPKALISKEPFKYLSGDAKILYCLMRDRMKSSEENGFYDEDGKVFFIYTIKEVCEVMNVSKATSQKLIQELKSLELIEKRRKSIDSPNFYYLKKVDLNTRTERTMEEIKANIEKFRNIVKKQNL
ncbi:replication initiator protein A [Streptobacillus felis]|uniref:replication initiator protein A n=1 Tax=Streptobacillus felis TaxID=1384509 RepID=UPI00082B7C38|nr:replication initiator protein A [Streptobacillus felis]